MAPEARVAPEALDDSLPAPLSSLVRAQMAHPSPIRQIMKMAERQNILAIGLNPDDVISFGGGWVNHPAPDEFRQAYQDIVKDPALFHKSGGYTATLGDLECREQIARFDAHLFGVPRLGPRAHRHRRGQHPAHPRPVPHAGRSGRHGDAARPDVRQLRGAGGLRGAGQSGSCGCRSSIRRRGATSPRPIPAA